MRKSIKRLIILTVILFIVSSIIVLIMGQKYTVKFKTCDDCQLIIDESEGKVDVLSEKTKDGFYTIVLKSQKPGKVFLNYGNEETGSSFLLYIHKTRIITDNTFFGKSTMSEVIPISLSIILIYIIYILFKRYQQCKNENLYQYKNIAYLGIIIFVLIITFITIISIFNYQGLYATVNKTTNSVSFVSFILFPIALITFPLVTINNIILVKKEGMSFKNLLGVFLGLLLCTSTWVPDIVYNLLMKSQTVDIYNLNSIGPYLYNFIETLVYLSIAYLECILIGTIIIAIKSVKNNVSYDKDYMIILGCKIRKDGSLTPLLKGRVDKAIEFRNKQLELTKKDLVFIPSGGKGEDEVISEAEAINNYLIQNGISKKQIIIEDKSTNTYENIKNSYRLISDKKTNVGISTTNYHILRAGLIATAQGYKVECIGSKTKAYFWVNAFIREFIGTLYSEKKKHCIVFSLTIVLIVIMIGITYLANNI